MPSNARLAAFAILVAVPAACTDVREVRDFTGDTALQIECGPNIARCEARARAACPRGYDVLATGENTTIVASGPLSDRRTMASADNVMKVKCR